MGRNVFSNKFKYSPFALQVDESTDIANEAQLLAFIRFIDKDQILNQLPFLQRSVTTKGENVFKILNINSDKWH